MGPIVPIVVFFNLKTLFYINIFLLCLVVFDITEPDSACEDAMCSVQ